MNKYDAINDVLEELAADYGVNTDDIVEEVNSAEDGWEEWVEDDMFV